MYKVKNISTDPRKLRVKGKDIIIMPGKEIETSSPPKANNIFEVKEVTKEIEEKKIGSR